MSISTTLHKLGESRWGSRLAAYVAGAVLTLALAPFMLWPVVFISLPLFFQLLHTAPTAGQAAYRGFAFGYGFFMAGTWWIANALLVDAEKFAWMIPFSVLGLSAAAALYIGLFGALVHRLRTASLPANMVRFAVLWAAVEYLRSIGSFGFPWNLLGYSAMASLNVTQLASVIGTYGLSLLIVLAGVSPILVLQAGRRMARVAGIALPVLMSVAAYEYGAVRLGVPAQMTATNLRIVQPSIPQVIKGTPEGSFEAMRILANLSAGMVLEAANKPDVTIWPETAFGDLIRSSHTGYAWPYSHLLITGAQAMEGEGHDIRLFNSVAVMDGGGVVVQRYDKHQLVPFGEFVPLRDVLHLNKITPGTLDFTRGEGIRTLAPEGVPPFSPLICYEAIFPWMAVDRANRPQWLVNVTNDAWYGDSPGPYQHFAMARMRAVEQGLPLARSANNGVSALIDPYGRIIAAIPLNHRAALDVMLPAALAPTVYADLGEKLTLGILVFLWLVTCVPIGRCKK